MLLTQSTFRPHDLGLTELSVRSLMASLYLTRKVNLQVVARRIDIPPTDHFTIIYNARRIEELYNRYEALAREFKSDYLFINKRILDIASVSIASNIIRGEYEEARQRTREILSAEAEQSEMAVHAARSQLLSDKTGTTANTDMAVAA